MIIAITSIGFGGLFAWFSYIAPLMTQVAGFGAGKMSSIMILAGAGMVLGNLLGGYMADHMRPAKATAILLIAMVVVLIAVFFFADNQPVALVLTFICGALSMSVGPPVNMMMLKSANKSAMMAAAVMQAAFNVANSLGAYLGGVPLKHGYDFNYPSLVGAGLALIGVVLALVFIKNYPSVKAVSRSDIKLKPAKEFATIPKTCEAGCP